MILTDKVTIKMNKNIKFCFERIIYNIYFYYYLDVHNYDEKSALISLKCKISGDVKSNKEYFILEFLFCKSDWHTGFNPKFSCPIVSCSNCTAILTSI